MRVIALRAENFLRLRAVEITPTGAIVKVSGANGAGKTSVLDSLWAALDHRQLAGTQLVHKGAKKAVIRLDLGEILIERVITGKSTELKITAPDGAKIASPQKFLDSLLGELSFDPLAFDRMQPKEQVEQLRRAVKVAFDFEANARAHQVAFDCRTDVNRRAKEKRAHAESLPAGGPREEVDEKAILDRMENAAKENAKLEQRKVKRASVLQHAEAAEGRAARCRKTIEVHEAEIAALENEAAECDAEAKAARERLAGAGALPEPIDVAAERAELERARAHNAQYAATQQRLQAEVEAATLEREAETLTAKMAELEVAKREAIASAKLPIDGLDLGDGVVLFDGLPYAQASGAERLRIAMAIAMAANPKIRIIRIADGSLLDSKSMAMIAEMAKAEDFQVWVEIVDETGAVGIVIEDGMVARVNE